MDKPLPHNLEYEKCLIGTLVVFDDKREQILNGLKPGHFYNTTHQLIFKTCLELSKEKKPLDLPAIKNSLQAKDRDVPATYLATLTEFLIPGPVQSYVEEIKNKAVQRTGIKTAYAIAKACFLSDPDGKTVATQIQDAIRRIEENLLTGELALEDPYKSLTEILGDKYEKDQDRDPDKLLGYELQKFKNLAKNIDGIQPGFYVVGAETNAGKTAFLCNLTIDLLDSNENLTGIYFSLDDNQDVILNRFLSIITGIPLNKVQRPPPAGKQKKMLLEGYDYLNTLAEDKRLNVRDASEIKDIEDLELEIKRRTNRNVFVVIDGLYNLDVGGTGGDIRKENIEGANLLKNLADVYRIPVICTGETRKKKGGVKADRIPSIDDIMETGKFAYNANLVLLLYPDKWEDYDNEDEPLLNLKYAKNKLSHVRTTDKITFIRKTSQIEEM